MHTKGDKMLLRVISWTIWLFFLICALAYIPGAMESLNQPPANLNVDGWFSQLAIGITIIAAIEGCITIALRHYVLVKPAQKGSYNLESLGGSIRFTLVNIFNWFIALSIPVYGIVLYIMSERIDFFYGFGIAGLILLIFHIPRLTPYKIK